MIARKHSVVLEIVLLLFLRMRKLWNFVQVLDFLTTFLNNLLRLVVLSDGDTLLLGTSDLTSRTWAGSIWLFSYDESKSAGDVGGWKPNANQSLVGASMDCGVTVGKFLHCSETVLSG